MIMLEFAFDAAGVVGLVLLALSFILIAADLLRGLWPWSK